MLKNKEIALMLCLLPTGWIGLHHAYLKNYKRFILYLFTFWTLIPFFLSLIDAYSIYKISEKRFMKRYCTEEEFENWMKFDSNHRNKINYSELTEEEKIELKKQIVKEEQGITHIQDDNTRDDNQEILEPDFSDYYGPWMNEDSEEDN